MASKLSSSSTLAWSWVIEALSSSNQVDTSLLIDIVKKASEISDDLGKNSRELVSLRILESLIVKGSQNNKNDTPAVVKKLELDPSSCCEDVLREILGEISATDLKAVAPEMLNWDVESFIVHKRASLSMRGLQKLKDAILEGNHSVLASLRERSGLTVRTQHDERSGLTVRTQHDDNIPVNGADSSGLAEKLEDCSRNSKVTMTNGNLSSCTPQNTDDELQENLPDRNRLPSKTNTIVTTTEILELKGYRDQTTLDDGCDPLVQAAKKFRQNVSFTGDTVAENAIALPMRGPLTSAPEGVVRYIEREVCNLEKEVLGGSSSPQNRDDDIQGPLTSAPEGVVGYIEREVCNLEKEVLVGSSSPQNRDDDIQGNLPDSNLFTAKRNRAATTTEKLERETYEDQIPLGDGCDSHGEVVKKFKQDANSIVNNVVEDSVASPVHGLMTVSSERIVEHIEGEGRNLEKEVKVGGIESNGSPHDDDDDDEHPALKRLAEGSHDHLLCPPQVHIDDNKVVELSAEFNGQKYGVGEANENSEGFELRTSYGTSSAAVIMEKNISVENPIHNFEGNFQQNPSGAGGAKDDMHHNPDFDMTSNSDEYHDERMDIALKKDAFCSSQCIYSQDSFATQAKYCVKCHNEGQLLVCSSNTCQLAVHPSCLSSATNFYGDGKFYCPFCAYSRTISEYIQVKKKASCARKDLGTFIGVKTECRSKKFSMRSGRAKRNQLRKNDDLCLNNERNNGEDFVNKASNFPCRENMDNKHQEEPPISGPGDRFLFGEKVVTSTDGTPNILVKGNLERKDMEHDCQSPRAQVEQLVVAQPIHRSDDDDGRETHSINSNEGNAEARRKKGSEIPESALSREPVCGPITESSEEDNGKPISDYSMRSRKSMKQYTYPAIPQLRRKPIPWTKVEEEKLKEGVQRLSTAHDRSIPWKKILEFGDDVFQRGRTTIDLKDKWRNICKGGPR